MDRSPPASRARIDFALLLLCFLVSGVAGLIYQTAWTQQFTLVFGASELAVVAVLAAYMSGLTLGAWVVKHVALAVRRPVLVYALLELGIAVAALLVPYALELARTVQVALLGGRDLAQPASSSATVLFHFFAAFAILIVPTGLMGATLPILVRHLVRAEEEIGPRAAAL